MTFPNMVDAYYDAETIPLTSVVGGRIDLAVLTEELDRMYPDDYPDHEMTTWEAGRMAGAIAVIRYLKSKLT
jgi:hypothetical protein